MSNRTSPQNSQPTIVIHRDIHREVAPTHRPTPSVKTSPTETRGPSARPTRPSRSRIAARKSARAGPSPGGVQARTPAHAGVARGIYPAQKMPGLSVTRARARRAIGICARNFGLSPPPVPIDHCPALSPFRAALSFGPKADRPDCCASRSRIIILGARAYRRWDSDFFGSRGDCSWSGKKFVARRLASWRMGGFGDPGKEWFSVFWGFYLM